MDHPSDSESEAILESRPAAGWIPTLLDWGAVPHLINLINWPNQADTRPWPGAHAAAGDLSLRVPKPKLLHTSGLTYAVQTFNHAQYVHASTDLL